VAEQFEQPLDGLDVRLLRELTATPRAPILELSRRLGIARNTVYARLARLQESGVIRNFGPVIELEAIGYGVTAFTTVELLQGRFAEVIEQLKAIPEVIEVHTIAGQGDLLVRIAAHSNKGIMVVVEEILRLPLVDRTTTAISLEEAIHRRTMPVVEQLVTAG
jgi:DNA-binding Lrp family transcriptional regulator